MASTSRRRKPTLQEISEQFQLSAAGDVMLRIMSRTPHARFITRDAATARYGVDVDRILAHRGSGRP